jgi:Flp pilus assembly secretin CpaC
MIVTVIDEDTAKTLLISITVTADPQEAQLTIRDVLPTAITYWTAYHAGEWLSTSEL